MMLAMRGDITRAQQRLARRRRRRDNRIGIHALFNQRRPGQAGAELLPDLHRNDGRLTVEGVVSQLFQALAHILGVFPDLLHVLRLSLDNVERGHNGRQIGRRQSRRENQGARMMLDVMDDIRRTGDEAAD